MPIYIVGAVQSGSAIAAQLVVEYIDLNGDRQTQTVVPGVTAITVQAPALIQFDATPSRGSQPGIDDTEGLAMVNLGYRMHFGENIGGLWPISGWTRNEDLGPPVFANVYRSTGSYTPRIRVADSLGRESTISFTITVVPPLNTVTLTSGWPGTFANRTAYQIAAGTDRLSWGAVSLRGAKNVSIQKTGVGADPIIGDVIFEERTDEAWNSTTDCRTPIPLSSRSKHVTVMGCSVGNVRGGSIGFDYCGIIDGSIRRGGLIQGGLELHYSYQQAIADATHGRARCDNHRYYRGFFIWNTGTNLSDSGGACWFGGGRSVHMRNVILLKDTGDSSAWPIRPYLEKSSIRHCQFRSTASTVTLFKGCPKIARFGTPTEQGAEDRFGNYDTERAVYLANGSEPVLGHILGSKNTFVHLCQFGQVGDYDNIFMAELAPQNEVTPTTPVSSGAAWETCNYSGFEDCWTADNRDVQLSIGGPHMFAKGNRRNMRAGAAVRVVSSYRAAKLAVDGPYYVEATNTRPVPSAF